MKRSEELRQQLKELKELKEKKFNEMVANRTDPTQEGWDAAWNEYYDKYGRQFAEDIRVLERATGHCRKKF